MALNSSGPLSFGGATTGQSINLELGVSATALASINSASFRTLAGVASGQISVSNFYGKSNSTPYMVMSVNGLLGSTNTSQNYPYTGGYIYPMLRPSAGNNAVVTKISPGSGTVAWAKQYATPFGGGFSQTYLASAIDGNGNLWAFSDNAGANPFNLVVFNSSGAVSFANTYSVSGWSYCAPRNAITDSAGNVYLLLQVSNSAYSNFYGLAIKFNSAGNVVWNSLTGLDGLLEMAFASSGELLVSGLAQLYRFNSTTGAANGLYTIALAGSVVINGLGVDSSGNIYVSGSNRVAKLNSSWALQWVKAASSNNGTTFTNLGVYRLFVKANGTLVAGVFSASYQGSPNGNYAATAAFLNTSGDNVTQNSISPIGLGNSPFNIAGNDGTSFSLLQETPIAKTTGGIYFDDTGIAITSFPLDATGTGSYLLQNKNWYMYGGSPAGVAWNPVTGITPSTSTFTTSSYTITATARTATTTDFTLPITTVNGAVDPAVGSVAFTYPGSYTWIAPTGVTSVSVVCVGGGGGGARGQVGSARGGGGGGGLAYRNNIAVTGGSTYTIIVGVGGAGGTPSSNGGNGSTSSFDTGSVTVVAGAGTGGGSGFPGSGGTVISGTGGGNGGTGGNTDQCGGGGGAGGYSGAGGNGGSSGNGSTGAGGAGGGGPSGFAYSGGWASDGFPGGGTGLGGQGPSGAGGTRGTSLAGFPGSYGRRGWFGAGASSGNNYFTSVYCSCYGGYVCVEVNNNGGPGANGGVRIVWPGSSRTFPSTNVGTP